MEEKLRELCERAADGARKAIRESASGVRKEGSQFFDPIDDLDFPAVLIQVTHLGGPRGEAIELSVLETTAVGPVGKLSPEQVVLLDEFVRRGPAVMAERLREKFLKLLGAGVTRDEIVYHVDLAVAESVMHS
jgi:hypothetical protein